LLSEQKQEAWDQRAKVNKEFNLNTLRVVNAGSSKGEAVFVYDLTSLNIFKVSC
jgi:hypothetical protein